MPIAMRGLAIWQQTRMLSLEGARHLRDGDGDDAGVGCFVKHSARIGVAVNVAVRIHVQRPRHGRSSRLVHELPCASSQVRSSSRPRK